MLTPPGQISAAVAEGRVLDQQQAQQLWAPWPWLPAIEGQDFFRALQGAELHRKGDHRARSLAGALWLTRIGRLG